MWLQGGVWHLQGAGEAASRRWLGRACAHGGHTPILLAKEEDDKGALVGWAGTGAGPAGLSGERQVSSFSFIYCFCFLLFCSFRALLKILRHISEIMKLAQAHCLEYIQQ